MEVGVCATELEVAAGAARIWNGRIAGEHMSGSAKLRAVRGLAARYGIDLSRSYAYGDSSGDLQMLEAVGNAIAVNPTRRLARIGAEARLANMRLEEILWRDFKCGGAAVARRGRRDENGARRMGFRRGNVWSRD